MKVRCSVCTTTFEAQRRSATFCSQACRQRSSRADKESTADPVLTAIDGDGDGEIPGRATEHPLVTATRRELTEADRLDSVVGQQAMRLAEKMCAATDTGSALAAVSKEFRAVMAEALADVAKKADSLDELAARRMQRASGA